MYYKEIALCCQLEIETKESEAKRSFFVIQYGERIRIERKFFVMHKQAQTGFVRSAPASVLLILRSYDAESRLRTAYVL